MRINTSDRRLQRQNRLTQLYEHNWVPWDLEEQHGRRDTFRTFAVEERLVITNTHFKLSQRRFKKV